MRTTTRSSAGTSPSPRLHPTATADLAPATHGARLGHEGLLDTIFGHIRNLDGYRHKLVAVTTYSTNYGDPLLTGVIAQVNAVVADRTLAWRGIVADGFGAFAAASAATGGDACAAGLLIVVKSAPMTCDSHPSPAGRDLMARAIVNAHAPTEHQARGRRAAVRRDALGGQVSTILSNVGESV